MNNLQNEFNERKIEIDLYFSFLSAIESGTSTIKSRTIDGNETSNEITNDLSKILKANGFLLLYNLVESTVRKSIDVIFERLYNEQIPFENLSEHLKNIWVSNHILPLKKGLDAVTYDKISKLMFEMANNIVDNNINRLDADCIKISGNIDAQEIRNIAKQVGFRYSSDGQDLLTIKQKRNHLAHGEKSFIDVGKDYAIQDLLLFKDKTYDHLQDMMNKISDYLNNGEYKK